MTSHPRQKQIISDVLATFTAKIPICDNCQKKDGSHFVTCPRHQYASEIRRVRIVEGCPLCKGHGTILDARGPEIRCPRCGGQG